jgi:carbon-monoxide dehydrogenase large subunit
VACLQRPLAQDRVRYVGEPIAFVIAESRYLAEDAVDLVDVDYEPLPAVTDARRAVERDAPVLHDALGANVVDTIETHKGDAAGAMASVHTRVRERLAVQRHTGVPLETRGLTAGTLAPGCCACGVSRSFRTSIGGCWPTSWGIRST